MAIVSTPIVTNDPVAAADVLAAGGLAAIPTETVYGLAADASQPAAIARIFEVKGRPADHPLILHVGDPNLDRWHQSGWIAIDGALGLSARRLAQTYWPGPLTMVLPAGPEVPRQVTGGRDTVALRVPAHPVAQAVLNRLDRPVAAPSANRFGRVSPTTAAHVVADIGALLQPGRDIVLDGGASTVGLESTIVELGTADIQLLRPGAHTWAELEATLGRSVRSATGPARASGMLAAHYAPRCRVVMVDNAEQAQIEVADEAIQGHHVEVLDLSENAESAARRLYASLREADAAGADVLIVIPPPPAGIGIAVRDRLQRAAASSAQRPSRRN